MPADAPQVLLDHRADVVVQKKDSQPFVHIRVAVILPVGPVQCQFLQPKASVPAEQFYSLYRRDSAQQIFAVRVAGDSGKSLCLLKLQIQTASGVLPSAGNELCGVSGAPPLKPA
jgi:hypothetical protein